MSQSKVERRKYEKKHREQIKKKEKAKKALAITAVVIVICGILGATVGVRLYKTMPKYVKADKLSNVVEQAWYDSGYEGVLPATATDAEDDSEDTTDDASNEDSVN